VRDEAAAHQRVDRGGAAGPGELDHRLVAGELIDQLVVQRTQISEAAEQLERGKRAPEEIEGEAAFAKDRLPPIGRGVTPAEECRRLADVPS
jgi:hypothetical protein